MRSINIVFLCIPDATTPSQDRGSSDVGDIIVDTSVEYAGVSKSCSCMQLLVLVSRVLQPQKFKQINLSNSFLSEESEENKYL